MHFEDITKLLELGWLLWPRLSPEKLPKCVTELQQSESAGGPGVFGVSGRSLTDKCQVPWTSRVMKKSCFCSQTFAEQCERLNDIISRQSWADWW